jgi:hypothetical protein
MATVLLDSSNQAWQLGVNNAGAYTTTPVVGGGPSNIILKDTVLTTIWSMTVTTLGALMVTPSSGAIAPNPIATSPNGVVWQIIVVGARIGTILHLPAAIANSAGCAPLLKDPFNVLWQLGVTDDGTITITSLTFMVQLQRGPILKSIYGGVPWQLSVDAVGNIQVNIIHPEVIRQISTYIPLVSPGGFVYNLQILDDGTLITTSSPSNILLPNLVPYIPDVSMSVYNTWNNPVICPRCGNANVVVSADLSCWCCACNSFVFPEDTTIIVVLDE